MTPYLLLCRKICRKDNQRATDSGMISAVRAIQVCYRKRTGKLTGLT